MQGTGGGQLAEFRIRRRVPKEISQPRGQSVVVQTAGLLLQVKIGRRAEYGGVAGEHRLGEGTAGFHRAEDDRQETHLFLGRDGRAVSLLHETTEQTLGILGRILGHDVISKRRAHGALGRQIIEQYRVRRGRPLRCERPLDFDPAHHQPGLPFRGRQGILRSAGTRTGTIEPDGVDLDGLASLEDDVDLVDSRIRIEVDVADATQDARVRHGIDRHGLGPSAFGDIIEVWNMPSRRALARGLARPHPDGVTTQLHFVSPGTGRTERTEVRLHRLIGAVHDAHAFFVPELGIRLTDGHLGVAATDVRLTREAERREGGTLRGHVEFRELHLAGIAALLAGVETLGRGIRLLDRRKECRLQAFFRGRQVTL